MWKVIGNAWGIQSRPGAFVIAILVGRWSSLGPPRRWPSPGLPTRPGAFVISPEKTELAWEGLVARLSAQEARWAVTKIMGVWVPLPYASFAPEWIYRVPGRYGPPDHHSFLNHESVWGTAKLVKCNYLVAMAWGVTVGLCFINFIQCRSALCISHPMHSFLHSFIITPTSYFLSIPFPFILSLYHLLHVVWRPLHSQ